MCICNAFKIFIYLRFIKQQSGWPTFNEVKRSPILRTFTYFVNLFTFVGFLSIIYELVLRFVIH